MTFYRYKIKSTIPKTVLIEKTKNQYKATKLSNYTLKAALKPTLSTNV